MSDRTDEHDARRAANEAQLAQALRAAAEEKLARMPHPEISTRPVKEILHELQISQIELKMQNDELRRARLIVEETRDRYIDFYDFAPVGYLTLSRDAPPGSSVAGATKAVEALQAAAPYELGSPGNGAFSPALYPVFVRGEAYLAGRQGSQAAAEFQKILDHRGVVVNEPIGALAHLGLGRAYAHEVQSAQGADAEAARAKSRAAYQDFLTLWKDADPDIPSLKEAKAEYAKLQ